MLYAAPNRLTRHRRAKLDLPRSDSMRAPGDAIGLLALECAMDELADALALDPVELRLRNDTQTDPEHKRSFSSRRLAEALREGADRFGWNKRVAKPASKVRTQRSPDAQGSLTGGYWIGATFNLEFHVNQPTRVVQVRLRHQQGQILALERC